MHGLSRSLRAPPNCLPTRPPVPCSIRGAAVPRRAICGPSPAMIGHGAVAIHRLWRISTAPGRGGKYAVRHLAGYNGILQVDGYVGYDALTDANRAGGSVMLAFCWSHFRRRFYEIAAKGQRPHRNRGAGAHWRALQDRGRHQRMFGRRATGATPASQEAAD